MSENRAIQNNREHDYYDFSRVDDKSARRAKYAKRKTAETKHFSRRD